MVTAASDSHISESLRLIGMIQAFMPDQKIIFYDLGGNENNNEVGCNYRNSVILYWFIVFSA